MTAVEQIVGRERRKRVSHHIGSAMRSCNLAAASTQPLCLSWLWEVVESNEGHKDSIKRISQRWCGK
jgi:hypothetical protein